MRILCCKHERSNIFMVESRQHCLNQFLAIATSAISGQNKDVFKVPKARKISNYPAKSHLLFAYKSCEAQRV